MQSSVWETISGVLCALHPLVACWLSTAALEVRVLGFGADGLIGFARCCAQILHQSLGTGGPLGALPTPGAAAWSLCPGGRSVASVLAEPHIDDGEGNHGVLVKVQWRNVG